MPFFTRLNQSFGLQISQVVSDRNGVDIHGLRKFGYCGSGVGEQGV
jgi:hypothetical protein